MGVEIRPARRSDDRALAALDRECWSPMADVVSARAPDTPFFGSGQFPEDVLVATLDGRVVGWARLGSPTPLPSNSHVQQLQGLAVHPDVRRQGIAKALLSAALKLAWSRKARKVCLRVLSTNPSAQSLYLSAGFSVEGVLVNEFYLHGQYVDDLLMARFESAELDA